MTANREATPEQPSAGAGMARLLTLRDVTAATALSRSAVYRADGRVPLPKPTRVGTRTVRWVEQEVLDFIASRPELARIGPPHSRG